METYFREWLFIETFRGDYWIILIYHNGFYQIFLFLHNFYLNCSTAPGTYNYWVNVKWPSKWHKYMNELMIDWMNEWIHKCSNGQTNESQPYISAYHSFQFLYLICFMHEIYLRTNHFRSRGCLLDYARWDY